MTAIAQATSQAVAEWSTIFPRQATDNLTSSVTFMKKLTVVAVSSLTYLKGIIPDENYIFDAIGGLKIRTLKKKCKDDLAQFISTALTQAFEAFDKKYLQQLAICFYDGGCDPDNLFEYHIFEYSYREGGVSVNISSKSREMKTGATYSLDSVRAQTSHLLRACVVMAQSCQPRVLESCDVSIRLHYNQDAPEGYQPPGYWPAGDCADPLEPTRDDALQLAWVDTPYHRLTLSSYIKDSGMRASNDAIPSQNPPKMTQASSGDSSSVCMRCACNNYDCPDAAPAALLTCQYCGTQQHAVCYGLTAARAARAARAGGHCCAPCAARDPRRAPSDRTLAGVDARKGESIAIFRRVLELCSHVGSVATRDLSERFGLSHVSASKLMKLLDCEGIIVRRQADSDITTQAKIIPEKLKSTKMRYFQSLDEEDYADQLMAEVLMVSQHSQSDHVETTSLQNASRDGGTQPEANYEVDDSTMQQYREALIMVERMDVNVLQNDGLVVDKETTEKKSAKRKMEKEKKVPAGVKTKRIKIPAKK